MKRVTATNYLHYITRNDKGYITVSLASTCCVSLDYEDNISAELATKEKESKADFDI